MVSRLQDLKSPISSDKIKAIKMISNKFKGLNMVTLVLQFEEILCSVNLNNHKNWTVWSHKQEMIKQFIVQGYGNKIFFAAKGSTGDVVNMLEYLPDKDELTKTEVIKLAGCSIILMQPDNDVMPSKQDI